MNILSKSQKVLSNNIHWNIDFLSRVHFVGIGGIGMSALARLLNSKGIHVSGSDDNSYFLIQELVDEGIVFKGKGKSSNITKNIDLVVYSSAVPDQHVELVQARNYCIPTASYAQLLGKISQEYFTIAICGTHGKSTTTAMAGKVLIDCGLDPTVIVGTLVPAFQNKNIRIGASRYLIVEACEYKRSFLHLHPNIILITNIDGDHYDYYTDFNDYCLAFNEFVHLLPSKGSAIGNFDDPAVREILSSCRKLIKSFGVECEFVDFYLREKDIFKNNEFVGHLNLQLFGHHNYLNALAVSALSDVLTLNQSQVVRSLNNYSGSWRRFEFKGTKDGVDFYEDYAHHPREIQATIAGAREKYGYERRIVVCFQPHQFNRTKKFFNDFAASFKNANLVIIPNIYAVRDSKDDLESLTCDQLVQEINKHQIYAVNGQGIDKSTEFLKENLKSGDICILMGAGDVWKITEKILNQGS